MSNSKTSHFPYGKREISHLKSVNPEMSSLIDRVGLIKREINPDPFSALLRSIVGQQISTKAAQTVWQRIKEAVGEITPQNILRTDPIELQKYGLSHRKVGYVVDIASSVHSGEVDFKELQSLPDEEVIKKLSLLPGVGVWTAEMLLIFSFGRADVMSFGDLGIRRGLMLLHELDELSKDDFAKYRKLYSPYSTTASLYLWELAGGQARLADPTQK